MDTNNWRAAQGQVQMSGQVIGGDAVPPGGMEGTDWRTQLQQESRQRNVNKIMETLKRHLPLFGQEGLQELKKIAVRFEEKIYTAASSESDYLRKISLKTMETKSQNPMANSLQSNAAATSQNPQDPASLDSSSQTVSANGGDWQEEIYQKIKSMHEMYYPELNEMYQQMVAKLQQHDAIPQQPKNEQLEKLRFLKPIPDGAWTHISMDFIEGLPNSHAQSVAKLFLDMIYRLHGKPVSIVTDRDAVFTSSFWKELFKLSGIQLAMSLAYHPQTDGQTERLNQCLENYLRSMVHHSPRKWLLWLPLAEYWYNTNFHTGLKLTAFQALYGYKPSHLAIGPYLDSAKSEAKDFLCDRHHMHEKVC